MALQTVFFSFGWVPLENFRKKQFLPRKPALLFSPSTWNTIGLFCKPPPGMGDQKVRKGPSPSILRTTIGKSWHCQNWRSTTPRIPEFWHKGGFGDKKSVTCDNQYSVASLVVPRLEETIWTPVLIFFKMPSILDR